MHSFIDLIISNASNSSSVDITNEKVLSSPVESSSNFNRRRFFKLIFSFIGLSISHLLGGLLQERIMTRKYSDEKFTNSQYLVVSNRLLPMI